MATQLTFSAQVDDFVRKTEQRMTAVFRESAQRVVSAAQQNTPVDTGFLRASVRASTTSMPQIDSGAFGKAGATYAPPAEYVLVINNAKLGQPLFVGYTASYSAFVEFGTAPHLIFPKEKFALHWMEGGKGRFAKYVKHPGTRPVAFVGRAAAQWPQIVSQVSQELKDRIS